MSRDLERLQAHLMSAQTPPLRGNQSELNPAITDEMINELFKEEQDAVNETDVESVGKAVAEGVNGGGDGGVIVGVGGRSEKELVGLLHVKQNRIQQQQQASKGGQ